MAMPILAHLDDPPRPRWPGILIGLAIALPIAGVFVAWVIPALVDSILGGARDLDSRLRAEDGYMQSLCSEALDEQRDGGLCGCVLGTEYPSLDCQLPFRAWTLARQVEACGDATAREASKSFCACVDVIAQKAASATPEDRDGEIANYENCRALPDAIYLPSVDALMSGG